MKRNLIVHVVWFGIAVAAFFVATHYAKVTSPMASVEKKLVSDARGSLLEMGSAGHSKGEGEIHLTEGSPSGGTGSGQADLSSLIEVAVSAASPVERSLAFSRLLGMLTPENAVEIMKALNAAGTTGEQRQLFAYAWGSMDGDAAIAYGLEEIEDKKKRSEFLYNTVTGWASKKGDSAIAWVEGLKDVKEQSRYRWSLVGGLADGDLGKATEYLMDRAREGDNNAWKFTEMVASEQLRNGVDASVRWAEGLADGYVKTAAMYRIATDFAQENPEKAAVWAEGLLGQGREHSDKIIAEISDEWAERDPSSAVAWLETLDEGDAKARGLSAAMMEWVRRGDPVKASEYLAEMAESPSRDQAVGGFAQSLAGSDPESAIAWAETIGTGNLRDRTLVEAGRAWLRSDPSAATGWLESGGVSVKVAAQIIARRR